MFGNYAGFIVASYGIVAATVLLLIMWVVTDGRTQAKKLAELEARGIHRRSDQRKSQPANS